MFLYVVSVLRVRVCKERVIDFGRRDFGEYFVFGERGFFWLFIMYIVGILFFYFLVRFGDLFILVFSDVVRFFSCSIVCYCLDGLG